MPRKTRARRAKSAGATEWAFALAKKGFSPFQAEPAHKVEIALARGKRAVDKCETIKTREAERETRRALKGG